MDDSGGSLFASLTIALNRTKFVGSDFFLDQIFCRGGCVQCVCSSTIYYVIIDKATDVYELVLLERIPEITFLPMSWQCSLSQQ